MNQPFHVETLKYRVTTGHACVDSVRYSARPCLEVLSPPESPIAIFRHLRSDGEGRVQSARQIEDREVLIMGLSNGDHYDRFEGSTRFRHAIRRHALRYTPAGIDCKYEFPATASSLIFSMPKGTLAGAVGVEQTQLENPFFDVMDSTLSQLMRMLAEETHTPGFAADLLSDGLVRAVSARVAQHCTGAETRETPPIRISPVRLARVLEYVEAHLADTIALGDMAEVAGLSVFHFARVFKLETGSTPYQYVCSQRLARACTMLAGDSIGLAELSLACGFSSQAHFTSAFTKAMGISPGRFRRTIRGS